MSDSTLANEPNGLEDNRLDHIGPSLKRRKIKRPSPLESSPEAHKRSNLQSDLKKHGPAATKEERDVSNSNSDLYFTGAIRHSFVQARTSPLAISATDLYRPRDLQQVTIICFFIEPEFVSAIFGDQIPVQLYTDAKMCRGPEWQEIPPLWSCNPIPTKDFSCMHTKISLLRSGETLRFALTTSNFIRMDHELLDNIFYIHDFPRTSRRIQSRFADQLTAVLKNHKVDTETIDALDHFDLSACKIELISSLPGTYYGDLEAHQLGLLSMIKPIRAQSSEALSSTTDLEMISECCTSSIGNLNEPWIQSFRDVLSGDVTPGASRSAITPQNMKIIYASAHNVETSSGHGSENIVCNGKWSDPSFPKCFMYHYQSRRPGTLYHAKSILVHDTRSPQCLIFGSHNFSQAAWGNVHPQGPKARYPGFKTVMANYEVSVLVPGYLIKALLPPDVPWSAVTTYLQESLEVYGPQDRPHTVRIHR